MTMPSLEPQSFMLAARIVEAFSLSHRLAYAHIDPELAIVRASENFGAMVHHTGEPAQGQPLADVVWEFAGAEPEMQAILSGAAPEYQLERINRVQPDGKVVYLAFRVVPLHADQPSAGLILIVEDITPFGELEQSLMQERNELRLSREQLDRANAELRRLTVTDALTGLANRRRFDAALKHELERARRHKHATALLFVDIDNFKQLNDTYGHQVGDEHLRQLADILRINLRQVDLPARYGGEEFAIILPETELDSARFVAERLRLAQMSRNSQTATGTGPQEPVTISVGLAIMPDHASTPEELVYAADMALYRAKRTGKNKVVVYTPQGEG